MSFVPLKMDAGRICDGLSRIGYTPPAAITDIIDNSVTHHARHVWVQIVPEKEVSQSRKDNVKSYLIIDDGDGMNRDGLLDALSLGSSADDYGADSLSKFGLGLKSASFSQGETLEVVSSDGNGPFCKYRVSLPQVRAQGEYGAQPCELSGDDQELIAAHLPDGRGTIVRITDIRKGNHPSIAATLGELQERVGIIYYYFMADDALEISVDGKKCEPFDVLCTDEADRNGNLNEHDWDGREVRWIEKPTPVVLDSESGITAQIEITQLPHPPTFHLDKPSGQAATRDKYRIGAGNYGFYVYRNKRLISWAERLDIIPLDQDFYAYRGRIQINTDADNALNIDVKKSQIHLSGEAYNALNDFAAEGKRKSKNAWNHAKDEIKKLANQDATGTANRVAEQVNFPEELPGAPDSEEAYIERQEREKEIVQEQDAHFEDEAARLVREMSGDDEGAPTDEATREERVKEATKLVVSGQDAGPIDRIFKVNNVEDHALWEPYYDPDKKHCVRINEVHRFARVIYGDNSGNGDLKILVDLFLLQLAAAETYVERDMQQFKREDIGLILREYRRVASELLARLAREKGDELPRNEN